MITITKRLTFCAGHRVLGHESKCAHMHGHNYAAEITATGNLDTVGRVIDFAVIKLVVGAWIDRYWDHGFLINQRDLDVEAALLSVPGSKIFVMPDNPTAENMARFLLGMCDKLLKDSGIRITRVRIHETETCYADAQNV